MGRNYKVKGASLEQNTTGKTICSSAEQLGDLELVLLKKQTTTSKILICFSSHFGVNSAMEHMISEKSE